MSQLRLRSPSGCLTCKQRRKKCDETRPACQRCRTGNFSCLGYSHLDSSKVSVSKSSKAPEKPLFSYAPIRTSSTARELQSTSTSVPPRTGYSHPSERGDAETRGYGNAIMPKHAVERHDHGNIPQMLHWDPETTTQITQLVISQQKRLAYRIFLPFRIPLEGVIVSRVHQCDMMRWSMFLGAQITQMLLDGSHQKNYIDLIRHFHRQIVGSSVSVPDPDLCIRLTIAMDLALYAYMVSDTVIGYSLFRSSTSLFFHYASKFPHLWSDSSTISFFYALRAPQYEISKFVFWDTVSALILGIPPLIQYDTTVHSVDTDEQSALEWVYGCPLAVAILLAKINAWRVPKSNRNTGLDPFERREIGIRLQQWCPMPVYIEDNACNVIARLAVHECWRQAVLVYLYMGMYGMDSADPRVEASVRQIVQICSTIEDGNPLGLHLFVPCLIAGVAARQEKQRAVIRQRIHASRDTNSWVLRGADFVPVLDHLWHGAACGGRPVKWEDYVESRYALLLLEN